jgi:hypothetical protein
VALVNRLASAKLDMREALVSRFGKQALMEARGWLLALGLLLLVSALAAGGFSSGVNPASWLSAFSAFGSAGFLKWLALPLAILGGLSLLFAVAVHFILRSIHVGRKL